MVAVPFLVFLYKGLHMPYWVAVFVGGFACAVLWDIAKDVYMLPALHKARDEFLGEIAKKEGEWCWLGAGLIGPAPVLGYLTTFLSPTNAPGFTEHAQMFAQVFVSVCRAELILQLPHMLFGAVRPPHCITLKHGSHLSLYICCTLLY
jgi:hypothetical protein